MYDPTPALALIALPLVVAFAINMFAEFLLLSTEHRLLIAFAKSLKAIVIPSLIAAYALIIADVIASPNGEGGFSTRPSDIFPSSWE